MKTRESEEMYLETILLLAKKNKSVRSIDVAQELGYAKSSVSRAVGLLQSKEYIIIANNGEITLTESGMKKANDIYERHDVISELLEKVGASKEIAEENACRIEHVISSELFEILKNYLKKIN